MPRPVTLDAMQTLPSLLPFKSQTNVQIAIFLIAACAIFTGALAQNAPVSALPAATLPNVGGTDGLQVQAERQRIESERTINMQNYAAQRSDCYQRFSVNDCLARVRDAHNAQMADLKRQEISLNDAERKRLGAEKLQRSEAKTSSQAIEQQAQRSSLAQQDKAQRQQRIQQPAVRAQANAQTRPATPKTKAAKPPNTVKKPQRSKPAGPSQLDRNAKAAANSAEYAQRQQEVALHKADVLKKLQEKGKTSSPSLPVPSN